MQKDNLLKWVDNKNIAINNIDNIDKLHFILQTEQKGITPGVTIASGFISVKEIEVFTKLNAADKF